MLRSMAMVACTWDRGEQLHSLRCGPFFPGPGGFDRYFATLPSGGLEGDAVQGYHVLGAYVPGFLGQFGAVVLWHWPFPWMIGWIKQQGHNNGQGGTKVGLAVSYESVNQRPPWSKHEHPVHATALGHAYLQPPNTLGSNYVDYYENLPAGHKNHCAAVNVGGDYARNFTSAVEYVFDTDYRIHRPDFLFLDCFQGSRSWHHATNAPEEEWETYIGGLDEGRRRLEGTVAPVWGHNPGSAHPDLRTRVDEFFGDHTYDEGLDAVVRDQVGFVGARSGLGSGRFSPWAEDMDRWGRLARDLPVATGPWHRPDHVYVCTARTGGGFSIFHPGQGVVA